MTALLPLNMPPHRTLSPGLQKVVLLTLTAQPMFRPLRTLFTIRRVLPYRLVAFLHPPPGPVGLYRSKWKA